MIKINSNKIGRGIAIILAALILGYPVFHFGKLFYIIYAIEKHDDEQFSKYMKEYDQYLAQPYVDRYTPPISRNENIPESAFWIPKSPDYDLYVLVTPIEGQSSLFNVSLFYLGSSKKLKAQLIFKEGFDENNTKLSDFLSPKLPESQVEYQTKAKFDSYSSVPATITKKIGREKSQNEDYIEYKYLEYPQGYLVFCDERI